MLGIAKAMLFSNQGIYDCRGKSRKPISFRLGFKPIPPLKQSKGNSSNGG